MRCHLDDRSDTSKCQLPSRSSLVKIIYFVNLLWYKIVNTLYYLFNPQAESNWNKSVQQMYNSHEEEKKKEYGPRVLQVEKATMTAAVMSTSGGLSKECDKLVRQIAMKLSLKRGERYSDVVGFIRRRLRFDLLRTCVIALRGFKKNAAPEKIEDLEFNLRPVAASY